MKTGVLTIFALAVSCAAHAGEPSLKDCKSIGEEYRISPFLAVAGALQTMGQEEAVARLQAWAKGGTNDDLVIILSRMLFEKEERGEFRRPMIGGAVFLGDTSYDQWPLEPIAVYKGVPILITRGYVLGGQAEPSVAYLEYCLKNCRWSMLQYTNMETESTERIIADFIKTTRWKRVLSVDEEGFLKKQAEPSVGGDGKPAPQR